MNLEPVCETASDARIFGALDLGNWCRADVRLSPERILEALGAKITKIVAASSLGTKFFQYMLRTEVQIDFRRAQMIVPEQALQCW